MLRTVTALLVAALVAGPVHAEAGAGAFPRVGSYRGALHDFLAPPLATLGGDSIRFSLALSSGGPSAAVVITDRGDRAQGKVLFTRKVGLQSEGSLAFTLSHDDFAWLMGEIRTIDQTRPNDDTGQICVDGGAYLTEYRTGGTARWITGFCHANHANLAVAALMARVVEYATRRYTRALGMDDYSLRDTPPAG